MSIFSRWNNKKRKVTSAVKKEPALSFTPKIAWVCGNCDHAMTMHSPLGYCEEMRSLERLDGRYDQEPCTCQVDPAALATFLKSGLIARLQAHGYLDVQIGIEMDRKRRCPP